MGVKRTDEVASWLRVTPRDERARRGDVQRCSQSIDYPRALIAIFPFVAQDLKSITVTR